MNLVGASGHMTEIYSHNYDATLLIVMSHDNRHRSLCVTSVRRKRCRCR